MLGLGILQSFCKDGCARFGKGLNGVCKGTRLDLMLMQVLLGVNGRQTAMQCQT